MSEPELTDKMICEAMLRAEQAACSPGDDRCYGFPYGVTAALASRTPQAGA